MKIRLGFVSNSSSASYTLTLKGNKENINELVLGSIGCFLWRDTLKTRIENNIERLKTSIAGYETIKESFMFYSIEKLKEQLHGAECDLNTLNRANWDSEEVLELVFRNSHIIKEDTNNKTELTYVTSMHNNYDEGMPEILKEIVLHHAFEKTNVELTCKIDKDNG